MPNQMLVDATHPEETRVVVVRGNRVEEFDFESANRKQLRGNIYLAKVTRVEPSLQAAFVDYGGNRHGFLAFSEIHPDYYQIPVADRQALLEEEKGHHSDDEEDESEAAEPKRKRSSRSRRNSKQSKKNNGDAKQPEAADKTDNQSDSDTSAADTQSADTPDSEPANNPENNDVAASAASESSDVPAADAPSGSDDDDSNPPAQAHAVAKDDSVEVDPDDIEEAEELDDDEKVPFEALDDSDDDDDSDENGDVEHVGAEDAMEEVPERRTRRRARQYKIQEVIKRRQILLVQVVKEERGNKGAALTTYLSLAGRYSVLMPNTARGGGISRKITNVTDRKRLKTIASELEVADGMGVILRTAGASRTKTEIKRDFEYLLRLWENVRDLTLQSAAPTLVYEEGSLIKRSIRDLYNKDIDQVLVAGEEGYKEAKGFMRMLMPSHARNVQPYRDPQPIFTRMGIENQLDAMFSPQVTLKSGGYIVIDQTEALVSIDVNSGRSTREHNIEDTALSTNLEASEEISRQLRLRDLAGLVVIDFIDMEEKRNNRSVEKRLKDCLKSDRARIQVGRISHFGLMEMSRQRIRTGVLESSMDPCPHCHGTGYVRASASVALLILRSIEDHLLKGVTHHVVVKTRGNVALYILNQKRQNLFELEGRFGVNIFIEVDDHLEGKHLEIERGDPLEEPVAPTPTVSMLMTDDLDNDDDLEFEAEMEREQDEESSSKKRRRRRRRKKGNQQDLRNGQQDDDNDSDDGDNDTDADDDSENGEASSGQQDASSDDDNDERPKKSRRRGRRGGRRNRRNRNNDGQDQTSDASGEDDAASASEGSPDRSSDDSSSDASSSEESSSENRASVSDQNPDRNDAPEPIISAEPTGELPDMAPIAASEEVGNVTEETVTPEIAAPEPASEVISEAASSEEAAATMSDVTQAAEPAPDAQASVESTAENEQDDVKGEEAADADTAPFPVESKQEKSEPEQSEDKRPKRSGWWNRNGFL
ncbi:ribonuclease E [Cohaesibacter sp. ES.047]|uniref:ribonuclease E/G n=1 Tax=Cohaesibacter sp. ES.047 TaxID=1798205 RepID=UPI000BB9750D|nr:ribonuclease E/G [Cohaesibacter sp. ES.047]SNY93785.1 ribonuclease E [Cohaesibacter sp. ES.047]